MSLQSRAAFGNRNARAKTTTTSGTAGTIALPAMGNNTSWLVTVRLAARRTDSGTETGGYFLQGVFKRGANAAATSLVGSVSATTVGEDTSAWDATLAADTTAGGPKVTVTGEAAKTIRWTAQYTVVQA